MYIVDSYRLAVIFCIITMLGCGSWANTLKMTSKSWEFPLYYGDYSIGLILTTLLFGFTFGSQGMKDGILGGLIWCAAMEFNLMASEKAGYAISYGLGQGATMISAAWGVFIWKEFAAAPKSTNKLLAAMFALFIVGLGLTVIARLN